MRKPDAFKTEIINGRSVEFRKGSRQEGYWFSLDLDMPKFGWGCVPAIGADVLALMQASGAAFSGLEFALMTRMEFGSWRGFVRDIVSRGRTLRAEAISEDGALVVCERAVSRDPDVGLGATVLGAMASGIKTAGKRDEALALMSAALENFLSSPEDDVALRSLAMIAAEGDDWMGDDAGEFYAKFRAELESVERIEGEFGDDLLYLCGASLRDKRINSLRRYRYGGKSEIKTPLAFIASKSALHDAGIDAAAPLLGETLEVSGAVYPLPGKTDRSVRPCVIADLVGLGAPVERGDRWEPARGFAQKVMRTRPGGSGTNPDTHYFRLRARARVYEIGEGNRDSYAYFESAASGAMGATFVKWHIRDSGVIYDSRGWDRREGKKRVAWVNARVAEGEWVSVEGLAEIQMKFGMFFWRFSDVTGVGVDGEWVRCDPGSGSQWPG